MSLTKFTEDTNVISALDDTPSLPASQLKAKFDQVGTAIKEYINTTLTGEVEQLVATEKAGLQTAISNLNTTLTGVINDLSANISGLQTSISTLQTKMEGTILFEDEDGSNNDITLSESAGNFDYIEIFFARKGNYASFSSVKVQDPNNKIINLSFNHCADGLNLQIYGERLTISGTSLTIINRQMIHFAQGAVVSHEGNNSLTIYKIVGYKY